MDQIEELITELIRAAQDVSSAFEWGTGRAAAERALDEARQELLDAIEKIRQPGE